MSVGLRQLLLQLVKTQLGEAVEVYFLPLFVKRIHPQEPLGESRPPELVLGFVMALFDGLLIDIIVHFKHERQQFLNRVIGTSTASTKFL